MNISPAVIEMLHQEHQRDIQRSIRYQGIGEFSTTSQSNIVSDLISQAKQWLQTRQVHRGSVRRAHATV